jgi:hypothetical protein
MKLHNALLIRNDFSELGCVLFKIISSIHPMDDWQLQMRNAKLWLCDSFLFWSNLESLPICAQSDYNLFNPSQARPMQMQRSTVDNEFLISLIIAINCAVFHLQEQTSKWPAKNATPQQALRSSVHQRIKTRPVWQKINGNSKYDKWWIIL